MLQALFWRTNGFFVLYCRGFLHVAAQHCGRTVGVLVLAVCAVGSTGWRMKDLVQIAIHSSHFRISVRKGQSVTKCGRERYNGGDGCFVYYRSVFVCVGSVGRAITLVSLKPRSSCMQGVLFLVVILKYNNCMSWPTPKVRSFQTGKNKASPLLPLKSGTKVPVAWQSSKHIQIWGPEHNDSSTLIRLYVYSRAIVNKIKKKK